VKRQLAALWFTILSILLFTVSAENTRKKFIIDEEGVGIIPQQVSEKVRLFLIGSVQTKEISMC
jgi:hypothetical protein